MMIERRNKMSEIKNLATEQENAKSSNIDSLETMEIVKIINEEDKVVANAIEAVLADIAKAVDLITERFNNGGRIIYCGAGSSGRLGILDAVELTPTYSIPNTRVFGLIAGGNRALVDAVEGAEDSKQFAIDDLSKHDINELDTIIGIAASGRTPYTVAALEYGKQHGALTISVTNNKGPMSEVADVSICASVGPEVVSGSTRMKAGTSQKMIVNMLSTAVMIKSGLVYKNYMVNLKATNEKLVERSVGIISKVTNVSSEEARHYFEISDKRVAVAIVMIETKVDKEKAIELLEDNGNSVRRAINSSY